MPELGWYEGIVKVLGGAKEPLNYTEIAEEVAKQALRKTSEQPRPPPSWLSFPIR
ncbi:MAG: hypothetical protein ABL982_04000 [Vicinamibacterales bacterium]